MRCEQVLIITVTGADVHDVRGRFPGRIAMLSHVRDGSFFVGEVGVRGKCPDTRFVI